MTVRCQLTALFISATLEQVEQPVLAPARVVARAGRDGGDGLADRDNLGNKACKNILQGAKIYSLTCTGCTNWICVLGSELAGHCNKEK